MVYDCTIYFCAHLSKNREKKMKGLIKTLTLAALTTAFILAVKTDVFAGTGIYVGKDVSKDGTTLIGTSLEYETGMASFVEVIPAGSVQKGDVIEFSNGYEYKMPADNVRFSQKRLMSYVGYGDWGYCATNEYGVSVIADMAIDPCEEALDADPLEDDGIGSDKIAYILAATSKSARDAVKTLCTIYDKDGAGYTEMIFITDPEGAWVVENFTGHQYLAVKLPDDRMATFSNDPIIRTVDTSDKDTVISSKLLTLPVENDFAIYDEDKNIDLILTYNYDNAYMDEAHLRGWVGHDIFAPSEELDYDVDDDYDVFFVPDRKVKIGQAFSFFRNRFEGTAFDLEDEDNNNYYWGINNQAVGSADIIQVFPDVAKKISSVMWLTPANPAASPFIPVSCYADRIPESLSTDVEKESMDEAVIQFKMAMLNSSILPRRKAYGASIRQYWEGMETISAKDMAANIRKNWSEDLDGAAFKLTGDVNDFTDKILSYAEENCTRLEDELEWYFFRYGMRSSGVSDDEIIPFECSFDAVNYAGQNGWETVIEDGVFTATKDGKSIEIVFEGEDEGDVTFTGFDNSKLDDDFNSSFEYDESGYIDEEDVYEDYEYYMEEDLEDDLDEINKIKEEENKEEDKKDEQQDTKPAKETKIDDEAKEEITSEAAKQIEVDTIAELEEYFADKIASVPRDGWAEKEIAKQLDTVASDVAGIITRQANIDIIDFLESGDTPADYVSKSIAKDPAVKDVRDTLKDAGADLAALSQHYITSLYEDVAGDVVSGRLSQDGAVKILEEARDDVEGFARLYMEGVGGLFDNVFNTELDEQEFKETLGELANGVVDMLDENGVIDKEELGIEDLDIRDLTDADVEVVITLNEMDDSVIDGLSDLFGVDARSILDEYTSQLDGLGIGPHVEKEDHELEEADEGPNDDEIKAAIELSEILDDDEEIEIPQEVIDILREAIKEAQEGKGDNEDAEDAESSDLEEAEDEDDGPTSSVYTINIGSVTAEGGKVMIPAYMLKYFN